jgi:hypothetical protein
MSEWNSPPFNEGGIMPMHPHGIVMHNGVTDDTALLIASRNPNPYYKLPGGPSTKSTEVLKNGEIVFRLRHAIKNTSFEFRSPNGRTDDIGVPGISALNGQGVAGNWGKLRQEIVILGLIFQQTDRNFTNRWNLHTGGLYTIRNSGNKNIPPASWVMAYLPKEEEIGTNKARDEDERNGRITLWTAPYDPTIHKLVPKNIYECLSNLANQSYLNSFKRASCLFETSLLQVTVVTLFSLLEMGYIDIKKKELRTLFKTRGADIIKDKWSNVSSMSDRMNILATLSHVMGLREMKPVVGEDEWIDDIKDIRSKNRLSIRKRLFVPYSNDIDDDIDGERPMTREVPYMFPEEAFRKKKRNSW